MNLRDLKNTLNALPLHDLTPTQIDSVDATKGRLEVEVCDFENATIERLHSKISDLEDECGALENRAVALEGALQDCAESMRVMIAALRLKPEDNETYCAAIAALKS